MLPNGQVCSTGFVLDREPIKVKGIPVIYADKPGRNRNVYSEDTLKQAVEYYKQLTELDPTYRYVLIKHPKDESEEWAGLIAGVIDKLYYNDKKKRLEMDVTLLPTIWGDFVRWLLEHGYVIGTSIRGQATPEPGVYNLHGKQISVVYRTNLKLEGVDFVIYPSFITTHASKQNLREKTLSGSLPTSEELVDFERVLESYSRDLAKELDMSIDEVKEMIRSSKQEPIEEELAMNKDRVQQDTVTQKQDVELTQAQMELLKVQGERLQLELENKENQKRTLEQTIEQLNAKVDDLKNQIAQHEAKLSEVQESVKLKTGIIKELSSLEKELEDKKAQYDKLVEQLASAKEELAKIEEARKRAHKSAALHCCGKFFDEQNPPKIRIVPVDEKISESGWGEVDKDALRKLVWLTQDKELANQVFGLVEDWDGWTSFKYPVYQPMKSEEDGYDVDLVLNRYGLAKALGYMQSRGFAVLKPDQKKHLVQFLYKKYAALQKAGLAEIPPSLEKLAKNMKVLEKVLLPKDELASMVLESALATGVLELEGLEQLAEEDKVDLSNVDLPKIITAFLPKQEEEVSEAVDASKLPKGDDAIKVMILTDDNQPTDFANKYDLGSVDDFKEAVGDMVDDEDSDFLNMLKAAIYAYLDAVLDQPDDAKAVLDPVFSVFQDIIQGQGGNNNSNQQQTQTQEQTQEPDNNQSVEDCDSIEDIEARKRCKKNKQKAKEEPMVYEQLKKYFEQNFEDVTIESEDDVMEMVKKLVTDYTEVYAELQKLQLAHIKEQKVKELKDLGIDEEIINEELADITDEDELNKVVDKLKNIFSKVKESAKQDSVDPLKLRKGVTATEDDAGKTGNMFDKLMRNI